MSAKERAAVQSMIQTVGDTIACLPMDGRLDVLCSALLHEICAYPAGERRDRLDAAIESLPLMLPAFEAAMRATLIHKYRSGE